MTAAAVCNISTLINPKGARCSTSKPSADSNVSPFTASWTIHRPSAPNPHLAQDLHLVQAHVHYDPFWVVCTRMRPCSPSRLTFGPPTLTPTRMTDPLRVMGSTAPASWTSSLGTRCWRSCLGSRSCASSTSPSTMTTGSTMLDGGRRRWCAGSLTAVTPLSLSTFWISP